MGDLDGYFEVIRKSGDRRRDEVRALNEMLGEPDLIVPDGDDVPGATGYWRVKGGVISYVRYRADGMWQPESRREYTDEFITSLHGLLSKEPREEESESDED